MEMQLTLQNDRIVELTRTSESFYPSPSVKKQGTWTQDDKNNLLIASQLLSDKIRIRIQVCITYLFHLKL